MRTLDAAALAMLRELVAALEAGRAAVTMLQAETDEERALAVRWVQAAGLPEAPAPRGPTACPACGHTETWTTQHNTIVCPACGHTEIL